MYLVSAHQQIFSVKWGIYACICGNITNNEQTNQQQKTNKNTKKWRLSLVLWRKSDWTKQLMSTTSYTHSRARSRIFIHTHARRHTSASIVISRMSTSMPVWITFDFEVFLVCLGFQCRICLVFFIVILVVVCRVYLHCSILGYA